MVKCLLCDKNYKSSKTMKIHLKEFHNPKKMCKYCFSYVRRLNEHIKICKAYKLNKDIISKNKKLLKKTSKDTQIKQMSNIFILQKDLSKYNPTKIVGTPYVFYSNYILGKGSWGTVYYGLNKTNNNEVAVKIYKNKIAHIDIDYECSLLKDLQHTSLIPKVYYFSLENKTLVQSLLGPDLDCLFNFCGNKFSLKTIAYIGIELINRIEELHNLGYIHRDISPKNMVWLNFSDFDKIAQDNIILIDYGLSGPYVTNDNKHLPFIENFRLIGTQYFSSVYSSRGNSLSRRDDLESIIYCLIYFYFGKLPWESIIEFEEREKSKYQITHLKNNDYYKDIIKKLLKIKETISPKELCKGMPNEFRIILCYIKNLSFEEKPDYNIIKLLLKNVIEKEERKCKSLNIYKFSWEKELMNTFKKSKKNKILLDEIKDILFHGHPIDINNFLNYIINNNKY